MNCFINKTNENNLKITILSLCILFTIGCTGVKIRSLHPVATSSESNSKSLAHKKNTSQATAPKEAIWDSDEIFDLIKFQEIAKTPLRSREIIEEKFKLIKEDFINFLKENKALFPISNNIDFQVSINRNGSAFVRFFPDNIKIDSLGKIYLNNILNVATFDTLSGTVSCAKINGKVMNLNELIFLDSTKYYPYRTRGSIMKTVMKNVSKLKNCYDRYLRNGEDFKGKVTVKFAIDENGKVIFISVVDRTIDNKEFENEIMTIIKEWKFKKLHNPDDVTEVVYPFIFSI